MRTVCEKNSTVTQLILPEIWKHVVLLVITGDDTAAAQFPKHF